MPMWSGAMQRPSGCRCGMTFRHRYDEVGLPCSSTMGSPSPTSTYAISRPRTCRRCFWYGNAAEIMFASPLMQMYTAAAGVIDMPQQTTVLFLQCSAAAKRRPAKPAWSAPAESGRITSLPEVAIYRVARPSLGKPAVRPLWGHQRLIIWQTRASIFVSVRPVRQAVSGRPVFAHCVVRCVVFARRQPQAPRKRLGFHPKGDREEWSWRAP